MVIDTLRDQARGQNIAVLCLYCDYQARKDQSAVNIIGSLLGQVVQGAAEVQREVRSAFSESKKRGGQGPQLPDMLQLFVKAISSINRVYICVDAVDELLPEGQFEFLRALRQILQDAPNTRLFLTTRSVRLDNYFTRMPLIISIVVDQGDIARYLRWKMDDDHDQDLALMTKDLKGDIMETMLEKASEM